MKCRFGFVTNSSSTSYVVAMKEDFKLTTTDKKVKELIGGLSTDFQYLFEVMGMNNDDYSIDFINDTNEFADYILNRYSYRDEGWRFKDLIFNTEGKPINRNEPLRNADEKGLISVFKLIEGEYYGKDDSFIHWLKALKKGNKICIMKSSKHNLFMCTLMKTISESRGNHLININE